MGCWKLKLKGNTGGSCKPYSDFARFMRRDFDSANSVAQPYVLEAIRNATLFAMSGLRSRYNTSQDQRLGRFSRWLINAARHQDCQNHPASTIAVDVPIE